VGQHRQRHRSRPPHGHAQLYALTTPLLTTASGAKMGKTAKGAVWLNADMLSPYDYWQYWRNTEDADVGRFLKLFTDLPLDEIARLAALQGAEINEAKKVLATEATAMLHGRAASSRRTARRAVRSRAAAFENQRRRRHQRQGATVGARRDERRRHQALAWQEEAYSSEAGVSG
jgi:tyrosyl-tRNA synthetase